MKLRVLVLATGALVGASTPARAAFDTPVQIGQGDYRASVAAATDDAGRTTAILAGVQGGGLQLVQRGSSAVPWPAAQKLPGALGTPAGPVVAAAGQGALAAAWRIDSPKKYAAIAALVADPGAPLGAPAIVSDPGANGVRHPAIAVDPAGRAVLAYNTNTRAVHLSLRGAIAITLRRPGRPFARPIVVDPTASARPAVAIARDGRGIVAWTHDRRVYAASLNAVAGTVGKVKALTAAGAHDSVVVAAGPHGAATVAWETHRAVGRGTSRTTRYDVQALHRPDGATGFPKAPETLASSAPQPGYIDTVAMAADADGLTTVAWSQRTYGRDGNGMVSLTTSVQAATIANAQNRFAKTRIVAPSGPHDCAPTTVAARAGRTVVAWSCNEGGESKVFAAWPSAAGPITPTTLLTYRITSRADLQPPAVSAGLDAAGAATILTVTSEAPDPTRPEVRRVLATTGR